MGVQNEHREWVERTNNLTIEEFSITFAYSQPQTAYDDFTSAITNSRRKMSSKRAALDGLKTWKENKSRATLFWLGRKQALAIKKGKSMVGTSLVDAAAKELLISIRDENNLPDLLAEDDTSSSSPWTLSESTGKRSAAQTPQTSNKKGGGITMAIDEYDGIEEGRDNNESIDKHDDTSDEIVLDGLKVTKSTRAGNKDERTVVFDAVVENRKYLITRRPLVAKDKMVVGSEQTADLEESAKRTKRRKIGKVAQSGKNVTHEAKATKDAEVKALALVNQGETSMLSSSSNERAKSDTGRRSSVVGQEHVDDKAFWIYPSEFDIFSYTVKSANVGRAFNEYQVASLTIVNKIGKMATLSNMSSFLSMNFIWDLNVTLPHLDKDAYQLIREQYTWSRSVVSEAVVRLCRELDEQLADGQDIEAEVEKDLRSVRLLYEVLALKLPLEYLPFERGLEDTYCHGVIDALLTRQFPARSKYHLDWANKESGGSKERRVNGYKPDGIISSRSNHRELAFLEVKPPKEQHCKRAFLEDLWKLANYCKDTIDSNLRRGFQIRKAAAVQVFGHRMALYTMVYDHGIYHWSKSCVAYLPCDQTDAGRILPCLRLLTTLEDFLESIYTNIGPSTPPRIDYDDGDERPLQDTGRISKVTPTKRPMF